MAGDNKISIAGLDRATVLAALYNSASPLDRRFFVAGNMTAERAQQLIQERDDLPTKDQFDTLFGRVIRIKFDDTDEIDVGAYDAYNGEGEAAKAIDALRQA